jgi:hypothetical protein
MFRATLLRGAAAAVCACALASGLVISPPVVTEGAHGPSEKGDGWTVLAPVSHKNLTIFPVRGRDLAAAGDYITLDEGLRRGTVVVTERGGVEYAQRPMRRPPPNRPVRQEQVSSRGDGATVNELVLINKSGRKLLLLAGEVVVGGKQDRIVQEDRVVPAVSVPVALDVFCVEQGRWRHNASASSGRAGQGPAVASAPREAGGFGSLGAISHPKLRAAAQDAKEQGAVWSEVRANNAKLGTSNSTETYQEVYASRKVKTQLDDYVRALEREVMQPGVVGVVVARNGEMVWADLFASRALFAAYWPKLLKSYAVDALGDYRGEGAPTIEEARRYLSERDGLTTVTGQPGVYQLVKTEHPRYAVFELKDLSLVAPLRLHFNKMER